MFARTLSDKVAKFNGFIHMPSSVFPGLFDLARLSARVGKAGANIHRGQTTAHAHH